MSLQHLTTAFAFLGAGYYVLKYRANLSRLPLERVVSYSVSASAIPTGVMLFASAFNPHLLTKLDDAGIYIALACIALLYVSIKELFKQRSLGAKRGRLG
jgi:hypothetical protein